jgi:hypothetical protein
LVLELVLALSGSEGGSDTPSYTRSSLDLLARLTVEVVSVPGSVAVAAVVADAVEAEVAVACCPFDDTQRYQNHGMVRSSVERRHCVDSLPGKVHEEIEVCSGHRLHQRDASE